MSQSSQVLICLIIASICHWEDLQDVAPYGFGATSGWVNDDKSHNCWMTMHKILLDLHQSSSTWSCAQSQAIFQCESTRQSCCNQQVMLSWTSVSPHTDTSDEMQSISWNVNICMPCWQQGGPDHSNLLCVETLYPNPRFVSECTRLILHWQTSEGVISLFP